MCAGLSDCWVWRDILEGPVLKSWLVSGVIIMDDRVYV